MSITRLTVWQADLPLAGPCRLSGGRLSVDSLDATLLHIDTDAGPSGWGEGTPWGHSYLPAHGPGIRAGLETMAGAILGLDPRLALAVERAMDLCLPGHLYAKAPAAMACLDIAGRAAGLSMGAMLGEQFGTGGTPIASSVRSGTPEEMAPTLLRDRARGYRVHSVKIGGDAAADIARIHHLEGLRAPDERILHDVNRAWTRAQALAVMTAVGDRVHAVEQPGETNDDLAAIRPLTRGAIIVDETLVTLADAARLAREGVAEIFNINLNRVGGPVRAARIRDIALANGIDLHVMATGGSVRADAKAAHLAETIPEPHRLGVWACQDMLARDIAGGRGPRNAGGRLTAPDGPGLGVAPDKAALGAPVAVYGG